MQGSPLLACLASSYPEARIETFYGIYEQSLFVHWDFFLVDTLLPHSLLRAHSRKVANMIVTKCREEQKNMILQKKKVILTGITLPVSRRNYRQSKQWNKYENQIW